jgi:MFS transporter, FHS family, glucose/mannose:H+ symporter
MGTQVVAVPVISRQRGLLAVLFGGFVLTGIAISVLGPLLPVFINRWSLDDSKAGLFSTVAFSSSLVGVAFSSAITSFFGYRPPIVAGYVLMSLGLVGLNSPLLTIALIAAGGIGLGYGMAVPGTNLCVAEMGGPRSAGLVSLVNLAWGVGALASSPLVLFSLRSHVLPQMLVGVALFGLVLTVALLFNAIPADKRAKAASDANEGNARLGVLVTAALATLFFIYVGTEVSFSFWAATYAKRLATGAEDVATVAPMFFFGGLMGGRALTPLLLMRIRESRLALAALSLVIVGGLLLIASTNRGMAFATLVLAGLGCACLFPIYVAWLSRWYGAGAKRVSAIMFILASLGGAAIPSVVGFVSTHAGGLRVGLVIPVVDAILMILLLMLLRRQTASVS